MVVIRVWFVFVRGRRLEFWVITDTEFWVSGIEICYGFVMVVEELRSKSSFGYIFF